MNSQRRSGGVLTALCVASGPDATAKGTPFNTPPARNAAEAVTEARAILPQAHS